MSYRSCKGCKVGQSSSRGSTNCDLSLNLYTRNIQKYMEKYMYCYLCEANGAKNDM